MITRDDIRRSGMTTIPDLLRLAPGVQVAQINANKWAVSVRGFNGLFANKLLVLVDGRSLYNRLFSGVLWDAEGLMLDDIERIEVIRGPGAAMWGANAVNGVINIITRTAADTQGGSSASRAGAPAKQGAVRYGGTAGATPYRVYAQWTGRDESLHRAGHTRRRCVREHQDRIPRRLDTDPGALTLEGGLHGRPIARAVAQPRPADGRSQPDPGRSVRTRKAAICSAGGRTSAPAARRCRYSPSPTSRPGRSRWSTTAAACSTWTRSTTGSSGRSTIWWPAAATGSSPSGSPEAWAFR